MDTHDIDERLARAEAALAEHEGLRRTGFWPAVAAVRCDPALAAQHAERIAAIDRQAFEEAVRVRTSLPTGLRIMTAGTVLGVGLVALAAALDSTAQTVVLLLAWVVLGLSTHSLAHWLVGRALGIGFTHVFWGSLPDPFPGVKIDYATYLPTRPRARALMHASGALVSKVVPFAILAAALAMDAPDAAVTVLLIGGIVLAVADVVGWFVAGDWKKVRRELRAAKAW